MDRLRFPAPLPVGARVPRHRRGHGGDGDQGRHAGEGAADASRSRAPSGRRWSPTACSGTTHERARLDGKVAVVTGAAAASAAPTRSRSRARARAWWSTTSTATPRARPWRPSSRGGRAVAEVCAVGDTAAADALVARAVAEFGRLDVMVTNAGVLRDRVLWKMTDEDFDLVVRHAPARDVHLRARGRGADARAGARAAGSSWSARPPASAATSGRPTTRRPRPGSSPFARTWAMELARSEITVNAIVPTAWTQMTATIPIYAPLVARVEAGEPLPREVRQAHAIGMPEDCAALVVFLASDAAASVTGQAIGIGGDRLSLYSHPAEVAAEFREGGWTRGADRRELGGDGRRRRAELRRASCRSWTWSVGHERSISSPRRHRRAHARRAQRRRGAGPRHGRGAGGGGAVLRRLAAAADRAGGRRLLPRAAAWRR